MNLPDKIRLYVGKCDIKTGIKNHCHFCPIGKSIARKLSPTNHYVSSVLFDYHCWINQIKFKMCDVAKKFIQDFDSGKEVKPTKIILTKVKQ